jgi:transposase
MDNLSVHRGAWVRELVGGKGAEVLLLPPYSPDFKWDEKAEMAPRRLRWTNGKS